jgi:hypothetical protein
MMTACHHSSPNEIAIIPKVNDTERYPSPMGMPERSPLKKSFILLVLCAFKFDTAPPKGCRIDLIYYITSAIKMQEDYAFL